MIYAMTKWNSHRFPKISTRVSMHFPSFQLALTFNRSSHFTFLVQFEIERCCCPLKNAANVTYWPKFVKLKQTLCVIVLVVITIFIAFALAWNFSRARSRARVPPSIHHFLSLGYLHLHSRHRDSLSVCLWLVCDNGLCICWRTMFIQFLSSFIWNCGVCFRL